MHPPVKIGLTGGIGSGKSTAAKIFELLQVPVYYADEASKRLYHTNTALKAQLIAHFGADIYVSEQLDRSKLAEIVFADKEKLDLLNDLVHPATIQDAEEWMALQTAPYIIKEAALLFESGSAAGLDYVIGVQAPEPVRIKRVMDRDGSSPEQVLARMARQLDENAKMKLCDFIIYNDEQQLLIPQVLELHQHFLTLSGKEQSGMPNGG